MQALTKILKRAKATTKSLHAISKSSNITEKNTTKKNKTKLSALKKRLILRKVANPKKHN